MDFTWIAIALSDVTWIAIAFVLGFLARLIGLPPLIGFMAAGFLLHSQGIESSAGLQKLSDLGITLLLFTIGLKLRLRTLARPQVWAVAGIHMVITVAVLGAVIVSLAALGLSGFAGLGLSAALLIAFALSFSSTVFVVKVLEERGETGSLHGRVSIGILIIQDIVAVVFLAASLAKMPSAWALLLVVALFPLRSLLFRMLRWVGHGELLVLYGFVLALGGAELFELVGLKGDVGALLMGVMIASHPQSDEFNKTMLGFKDLFLLGFFLSVGLSGTPTVGSFAVAVILLPLVLFKSALFFALFTRFKLRSRTALLGAINLSNYSEFGLIVAALSAAYGWISYDWLIIIAIALSISFVLAAGLNRFSYALYDRYRAFWLRFQGDVRLPYDGKIDVNDARVVIVGMGGVGSGAYESMCQSYSGLVIGVDTDPVTVARHKAQGRNVIRGDPSDADFWERVHVSEQVDLVMLAMPRLSIRLAVIRELLRAGYRGEIAAIARYDDEAGELRAAGANTVFNIYREAGTGFAAHVKNRESQEKGGQTEI